MKIFEVFEADDYGRKTNLIGLVNAKTSMEARKKMAIIKRNKEIETTGFYLAKEISELDRKKRINTLSMERRKLVEIFA